MAITSMAIERCATAVIPIEDKYLKLYGDGDYVTLSVIILPKGETRYTAVANGRTITLNGYAFAKEFQGLCAALGVPCDY